MRLLNFQRCRIYFIFMMVMKKKSQKNKRNKKVTRQNETCDNIGMNGNSMHLFSWSFCLWATRTKLKILSDTEQTVSLSHVLSCLFFHIFDTHFYSCHCMFLRASECVSVIHANLFGFILFKFIRFDCKFRFHVRRSNINEKTALRANKWNTAVRSNKPVQVVCVCFFSLVCVVLYSRSWAVTAREWVNESEVWRWKRENWKSIFVFTWKSLLITMYTVQ